MVSAAMTLECHSANVLKVGFVKREPSCSCRYLGTFGPLLCSLLRLLSSESSDSPSRHSSRCTFLSARTSSCKTSLESLAAGPRKTLFIPRPRTAPQIGALVISMSGGNAPRGFSPRAVSSGDKEKDRLEKRFLFRSRLVGRRG